MTTPTSHLTIVTGASRGIGAALVARLLHPGAQVLAIARHAPAAQTELAHARGAHLTQWTLDLANAQPAAERLAIWLGGLAGPASAALASATLINNAGMVSTPAPAHEQPLAELSQALRVGLEATVLLSAAFLAATDGWAAPRRVLNISSGLGRRAMASSAAYCAAKAGMDHFTRALALEQALRPNPARVVAMAPGVIDTDMQAQLRGADPARFPDQPRFAQLHASGQLLTADACAAQLLARLAREDFGREPVADLREA